MAGDSDTLIAALTCLILIEIFFHDDTRIINLNHGSARKHVAASVVSKKALLLIVMSHP
jgi:hypothetical protein